MAKKKSVFVNPAAKGKEPEWVGAEFPGIVTEIPYNQDGSMRPDRGRIDDHLFEDDFEDDFFEAVDED